MVPVRSVPVLTFGDLYGLGHFSLPFFAMLYMLAVYYEAVCRARYAR